MRLAALVVPKSSPKIQATRSNCAIATRPQLRAPTMTSVLATFSRPFICCPSPVHWLYIWLGSLTGAGEICPYSVQNLYSYRQVAAEGLVRIGELSRRNGVSPELLRAWERRYRLLRPARSDSGLRLYASADVERVKTMQRHLA